jgi:hypothetical protein
LKNTDKLTVKPPGFFTLPVMAAPIETLDSSEVLDMVFALSEIHKRVARRLAILKAEAKETVRETADSAGIGDGILVVQNNGGSIRTDSKGNIFLSRGGGEIKLEKRTKVTLLPEGIEELLKKREIDPIKGGSYVFVPDEDKLSILLGAGELSLFELRACTDVKESFVVKIKPTDAVKEALDGTVP